MNATRCDQCGQIDDHPKVHVFNGGTFHHDCLSYDLRSDLMQDDRVAAIITAAEGGTRGAKLRAHIAKLDSQEA
ncbi:RING finger protein [Terrabacter terrigena]|uniref:Uncharacterized protein n=1 Tax=Terrabacter terrigena TaxID=574718 RepID=A0ABW3MXV6_9MICO